MSEPHHQRLLIVDFGSQVTQLIARRVREAGVYCEIHPFQTVDAAKIERFDPRGIVDHRNRLCRPASVPGAPELVRGGRSRSGRA